MIFKDKICKSKAVVFISVLLFLTGCDEINCKIPFPQEQNITEEDAINITRQAFKESGFDITQIEPVPYWENSNNNEQIFARNSSNKNQGYVLWRIKNDDKKKFHYSIYLRKEENYIICNGGPTK